MDGERQVGGLWCSEVLALLADYVRGALTPDARAAVELHVGACSECARFGEAYGRTVEAIRQSTATPAHAHEPDRAVDRLLRAIE